MIRKTIPDARLLLSDLKSSSILSILECNRDLPIEWSPSLEHDDLAKRLRSADIFLLPSLEDGWARTVSEASACGLPVIVTPNTGAAEFIQEGINGSVVPIRDASAIAEKAIWWWQNIKSGFHIDQPPNKKNIMTPIQIREHFLECIDSVNFS